MDFYPCQHTVFIYQDEISAKILGTSSLATKLPDYTLNAVHYPVVLVCMVTKHKDCLDFVFALTRIIELNIGNAKKWELWDLCHSALAMNLENDKKLFFEIQCAVGWDVEPRDPKGLELSACSCDCVISLFLKFTS